TTTNRSSPPDNRARRVSDAMSRPCLVTRRLIRDRFARAALLHWSIRVQCAARAPAIWLRSHAACKLGESDAEPVVDGDVGGEFVVGAAQVLDERVPGRDGA